MATTPEVNIEGSGGDQESNLVYPEGFHDWSISDKNNWLEKNNHGEESVEEDNRVHSKRGRFASMVLSQGVPLSEPPKPIQGSPEIVIPKFRAVKSESLTGAMRSLGAAFSF